MLVFYMHKCISSPLYNHRVGRVLKGNLTSTGSPKQHILFHPHILIDVLGRGGQNEDL